MESGSLEENRVADARQREAAWSLQAFSAGPLRLGRLDWAGSNICAAGLKRCHIWTLSSEVVKAIRVERAS